MTTFAKALKTEIVRLARREARASSEGTSRSLTTLRKQVAALKKSVDQLELQNRRLTRLLRRKTPAAPAAGAAAASATASGAHRFSPKGLQSHRTRLGLSPADAGRLLGVSGQLVARWEQNTSRPLPDQLAAVVEFRRLSKRAAAEALARMKGG
ncbi:MAG: hypothetical protein RJA99_3321 [Pseudomonadota bacterium]|jgi:DNA-binding transcriptional regulator YiaG